MTLYNLEYLFFGMIMQKFVWRIMVLMLLKLLTMALAWKNVILKHLVSSLSFFLRNSGTALE